VRQFASVACSGAGVGVSDMGDIGRAPASCGQDSTARMPDDPYSRTQISYEYVLIAERFCRVVGLPPIDRLLRWRLALAKDALRRGADAGAWRTSRSIADISR
jgi:hypothetical protein